MGNILVVDDERSIRITVKAFLEADGHMVEAAEDVDSAIALLDGRSFDVLLTDIILPRTSGVDLLRKIRGRFPHLQVIMMTGEPTLETASESLRLGAVDYLQKPIAKDEILKVVRNAMHIKNLIDEKLRLEGENQKYTNRLEQLVEERTHALAASEASLRQRAEQLSAINRLARKVNASITVDDAIQCGLQEIVNASGHDLALFFLLTGEDLILKGVYPEQPNITWQYQEPHRASDCLCGLAVKEGRAIHSSDLRSDRRFKSENCVLPQPRSFAALPLRNGSEIMGVLGIASLEQRDFQQDAAFLEALATEMSIGLNKSLLYEQVQQHAMELKESLCRIEEAEAERQILRLHLQRSQKMEAIGTLASGIAHDFNNILGAVIGYAELALLGTPDGSRAKDNLGMVLIASERAKDLVKQILAFSRQSEEERKPIQIAYTVKEVLKFMRASLPTTIEIRSQIDPDIGNIMADPVQIHQVLMNLCTNAHHAMQTNGGVLTVSLTSVNLQSEQTATHSLMKPGHYVKVSVKDTGHGMDAATLSKIFDPYFTTKEKGVGTGLGLAVVHGIVQKHGGAIMVESEPGKGSVFDLYFPAIQKQEVPETRIQQEMPTGHEQILLVDDERTLVDMGREMLEHLGYRVETRTSSIEALALFKAQPHRFDLVITDVTMPNMTGDKLALELKRIRPDLPIVLCTGYSERMLEERTEAIGIGAVVMKPILMGELARAIRKALGKQEEALRPPQMAAGR